MLCLRRWPQSSPLSRLPPMMKPCKVHSRQPQARGASPPILHAAKALPGVQTCPQVFRSSTDESHSFTASSAGVALYCCHAETLFSKWSKLGVCEQVAMGQRRKGRSLKRRRAVRMRVLRARTWNRGRNMMKRTLSMMRMLPMRRKVCHHPLPVKLNMCTQQDFKQVIQGTSCSLLYWISLHNTGHSLKIFSTEGSDMPCMAA